MTDSQPKCRYCHLPFREGSAFVYGQAVGGPFHEVCIERLPPHWVPTAPVLTEDDVRRICIEEIAQRNKQDD